LQLIAELEKKGEIQKVFVYLCKEKENLEEKEGIADKLGLRGREFRGRDETNCKAFQDGSRLELLEQGYPPMDYCFKKCSFRSECAKSGYLIDLKISKELGKLKNSEYKVIFATYDYFIEHQDDFHPKKIMLIVDDVEASVSQQKVSFQEISRSHSLVIQYEKELVGAGFQHNEIDKVKDVLLKLEQKRNLDEADFSVVGSLKDIFEWIYEEKDQIPCFKIAGLLKAIKEGRAHPEPDGYSFNELKKFRYNFDALYLGTTLNVELIEKTLTKKQLKKLKVPQTKDYGLANLKIKRYDVKVATSYWGYERKRDEFWREVYPKVKQEIEQGQKSVIFTYQKIEKELAERIRKDFKDKKVWTSDDLKQYLKVAKEIPDDVEVVITHYWGSETKGVNLFERFDKAIFVCLPIRNITEFQRFRKALGLNETTISDDCFNQLWQSIGRLRAFLKLSVEVVIIANLRSKIAKAVMKKLERFEIKEEEEEGKGEKIDELNNRASKILQEMGGIQLYDLIDYTEIPIGKASIGAISYLNWVGLGENFTLSENGEVWFRKPKKGKYEFERAFLKDFARCRELKMYQFEGWRFNFQRRGGGRSKKKGEIVEASIRKIRFSAYVQDVELYRKEMWKRKRILIYKAYDGEKRWESYEGDNWTKQKLSEMKEIVSKFNELNHKEEIIRFQGRYHSILSQIFDDVEKQARNKNLKIPSRSFLYFLDLRIAEGKKINPEQVMKEYLEIKKEAGEEAEKIRAGIPKELSKMKPEDIMNFVIAEIRNDLRGEKEGEKIDDKRKVLMAINLILCSISSKVVSKTKHQNKPTTSFDTS
jgi:hypothetical protein